MRKFMDRAFGLLNRGIEAYSEKERAFLFSYLRSTSEVDLR